MSIDKERARPFTCRETWVSAPDAMGEVGEVWPCMPSGIIAEATVAPPARRNERRDMSSSSGGVIDESLVVFAPRSFRSADHTAFPSNGVLDGCNSFKRGVSLHAFLADVYRGLAPSVRVLRPPSARRTSRWGGRTETPAAIRFRFGFASVAGLRNPSASGVSFSAHSARSAVDDITLFDVQGVAMGGAAGGRRGGGEGGILVDSNERHGGAD